jgi:hypothetical protein
LNTTHQNSTHWQGVTLPSALDKLTDENFIPSTHKVSVETAIKLLATNKDLRIFLQSITRYSKTEWANFLDRMSTVYQVLQSTALIRNDATIAKEIAKYPHLAALFKRLNEEY